MVMKTKIKTKKKNKKSNKKKKNNYSEWEQADREKVM